MIGTKQKLVTANTTYVFQVMLLNIMGAQSTTMKLLSQFAAVDIAFAGPRMLRGTSSTAHIQLMPCQPIAKTVVTSA